MTPAANPSPAPTVSTTCSTCTPDTSIRWSRHCAKAPRGPLLTTSIWPACSRSVSNSACESSVPHSCRIFSWVATITDHRPRRGSSVSRQATVWPSLSRRFNSAMVRPPGGQRARERHRRVAGRVPHHRSDARRVQPASTVWQGPCRGVIRPSRPSAVVAVVIDIGIEPKAVPFPEKYAGRRGQPMETRAFDLFAGQRLQYAAPQRVVAHGPKKSCIDIQTGEAHRHIHFRPGAPNHEVAHFIQRSSFRGLHQDQGFTTSERLNHGGHRKRVRPTDGPSRGRLSVAAHHLSRPPPPLLQPRRGRQRG